MNIVECKNLTKKYGQFVALSDLTVAIPDRGGIVGLLGPNGSGKTTLIKLLTGLLSPTDGSATIANFSVGVESKAITSYLSDAHALNDGYTVARQLEYFADFFADFDKEKARCMLRELEIDETRKIKVLSKGTKEKVALVLTLSRNAKLYILDEPIAGVDPAAREYILQTILAHKNENSTILMSTHLISEIEQYFDFVLFLKEGRLVLSGNAEEIRSREGKTIDELFREIFKWMM